MRRLVIALIVLAGLLAAVDFGSAALAESMVSRQMRAQLALADDPSVRINGFPFLTQAAAGRYSSVDVDAARVAVGPLRQLDVQAQLRDVSAPLPMLLGSGPKTLRVEEAEGTVRVPADDLERLVPGVTKLRIETLDAKALEQAVEDGGDPALTEINPDWAVRLVGTTALLGSSAPEVAVIALLQIVNGQVQIVPRDVRLGDSGEPQLPAVAQRSLAQLFTVRIDPGALPLQVTPTRLRARDGALEISGLARDLTLGGVAPSGG